MTKSQKLIASVFSAAIALSAAVFSDYDKATVSAADLVDESGFTYTTYNGKVTVTGYSGDKTEIAIPDTIAELPVTAIANYAFKDNDSITAVSIPDTVTSIGYQAFYDCDALVNITIPSSVISVGDACFEESGRLEKATIKNGVTGNYMFRNCDNLSEVVLAEGVTKISNYTFMDCDGLQKITIPDTVTELGMAAFANSALKEIVIPDSVVKVNGSNDSNGVFYNCDSLEKVTIGKNLTNIGYAMFGNCDSLTEIVIPDSVTKIEPYAFQNSGALEKVVIGKSVTSIGDCAFRNCSSVETVTVTGPVTTVGSYAFYNCDAITDIAFNDSLTSVGSYAFNTCDSLETIELGKSISTLGDRVFENCISLKEIEIKGPLSKMGSYVFNDDDNLEKAVFSDTTTALGTGAFYSCNGLKDVTLGSSITAISTDAFRGCDGLKEVKLPEKLKTIGENAFRECGGLKTLTVPDSVTSIGTRSFYDDDALQTVTLGKGLTTIGYASFYGCDAIREIVIPDSVTTIDTYAFQDCSSLSKVKIGEKVKSIGNYAFSNDVSLSSLELGPRLVTIGDYAFKGDISLRKVVIPDSVTKVGSESFRDCSALSDVHMGNSLVSLSGGAFRNCDSLKSVVIGESVTSIGSYAFYDCELLNEVYIPDSVTTIYNYSFQRTPSLKEVYIPDSVVKIENYVFDKTITLKGDEDSYVYTYAKNNGIVFEASAAPVLAPEIISSPSNVTAEEGSYAEFTVAANGKDIKYQWYWRKNANEAWAASSGTGYNTDTLTVAATTARNGYQYYCKITDANGNTVDSAVAALKVNAALAVTAQPVSKTVTEGTTAKFTVAANGTGLKYQWYWRKNSSEAWAASSGTGYNTNTLSVAGEVKRNGYQYYCMITDASGNTVKTSTVTLTVKAALAVTAQPVNKSVTEGTTAKFTVTASGTGLKYQWYWRKTSADAWAASSGTGYNTNTLSVAGETKRNGYQYYCKITDASGNTVKTSTVTLTVKAALAVTTQPVNKTVTEGTTAKFTVAASGTGLKYQWYWRKTSADTWTASSGTGYNTATLSVAGETKRNGYQYYCKITDASGNTVKTNTVTLTVKAAASTALSITSQPVSKTVSEGTTVKFTVAASGTGLKYQWYWKKPTAVDWTASTGTGYNTSSLTVEATKARNEYQYYCKITDASGRTVKSSAATLNVSSAVLAVVTQPVSQTAAVGQTVKFTVKATGDGLKYQWYWKRPTDTDWTASTGTGYNTSSLSVTGSETRNGYQYYCKITDASGKSVKTQAATLKVK